MATRCKVLCTEDGRIKTGYNYPSSEPYYRAKMSAQYDNNPNSENGRFFLASPSLSFELVTKDKHFEAGKSYYVDFTEVE